MAARLGDDGTLDTVIYCSECGVEQRYNFDPAMPDTIDDIESDYASFVDWCLEDFDSEHECQTPVCEICGEPAGAGGALCPVHLREAGIE